MANLTSSDKHNKIELRILRYEQKEEYWFSSEVSLIEKGENIIKGFGSFHINDFVELINGIKSLIPSRESNYFTFEPIEPYLKIKIKSENDLYIVDTNFCKGPIFEPAKYKGLKFITDRENLTQFVNQIEVELKRIDNKLEMKMVEL